MNYYDFECTSCPCPAIEIGLPVGIFPEDDVVVKCPLCGAKCSSEYTRGEN